MALRDELGLAVVTGGLLGWTTFGVIELYLHRSLAHRSVSFHPVLRWCADAGIWLLTALNPAEWAGVHRIHHRFADSPLDPHDPARHGRLRLVVSIAFVYRRYRATHAPQVALASGDLASRYGSRPWRTSSLAFQIVRRVALTLVLVLMLGSLRLGLLASSIQLAAYSVLLGYVTVTGHWSREANDRPVNRRLSAIVLLGAGLHANHHARPRAASQSTSHLELDTGCLVLRLLAALRLVRLPPPFASPTPCADRGHPPSRCPPSHQTIGLTHDRDHRDTQVVPRLHGATRRHRRREPRHEPATDGRRGGDLGG